MDELRYAHTEQWKASYGEQFAMAAHSALDVSQHPNRIGMRLFSHLPLANLRINSD
jgi:hypothetical protein